mgnify:CR=1 FL=1
MEIETKQKIQELEQKLKSLKANLKIVLELTSTDKQGLKTGTRKNGKNFIP